MCNLGSDGVRNGVETSVVIWNYFRESRSWLEFLKKNRECDGVCAIGELFLCWMIVRTVFMRTVWPPAHVIIKSVRVREGSFAS
jgi:hypothetical protein